MVEPVIEGGIGVRGTLSTEEGARLSSPTSKPSIKVREPLLSEILDRVHRAKNKTDKVAILKEENCEPLQQILQWAFNPTITSAYHQAHHHILRMMLQKVQNIRY